MIKVNYRALGMLSTNCYVVENPDSQKVLIVDPGDSPLEIERQIDEIDGDPEAILLTHGHFDHMLAADALRKNTISRSMSMKRAAPAGGSKGKSFRALEQTVHNAGGQNRKRGRCASSRRF